MANIDLKNAAIVGTVAVGGGTLVNTYLLTKVTAISTMLAGNLMGINYGVWVGGIVAVAAYMYFK